jgi:capsular polysaccharide transport system permease protein
MMMQEALRQVETARIEANRQVTYLSRIVNPVAPQEASYPRAFENTLLAFLVFSGIYLLVSLTASILREQVSN